MSYWRFRSEAAIKAVDYPATRVLRVAWQPGQGGLLACVTNHGGRLVSTGIVEKDCVEFGGNMGRMGELAWSPTGDLLVTVGDRTIIWNSNGTVNRELQMPPMELPIYDAPKFSKDGSFVSIVNFVRPTWNRQIHKFETATGALHQSLQISLRTSMIPLAWKDEQEVFSSNFVNLNTSITLWRMGQEEPLQTITNRNDIHEMSFNPKVNVLAFTHYPSSPTVRLWRTDTPDMAVTILPHDAPVKQFVWKSDNSDILATVSLGDIRIWETTTNTNLHTYNVFTIDGINFHASFSPDGRFIAVGREGNSRKKGEVKIVKFDTGDTVAVCEGSGRTQWSSRGEKLAVSTYFVNSYVFNVDKINFGINLKRLSLIRVASLLEGNLVNGKDEARKFLENEIPEKLVDLVVPYLK